MRELQISTPCSEHEEALKGFFKLLISNGDDRWFHPHELTDEVAREICSQNSTDYYCLMIGHGEIVAYGMLRGWEEGFEIPSLGIAVSPNFRNTGAGKTLLTFLHLVAGMKNCEQVMLKVYRENTKALELFKTYGYAFRKHSNEMLIGIIKV